MTNETNDNKPKTAMPEDILSQVGAFGSDRSRWPKQAGEAALRDPAVAKELREAAALDKLLALAALKPAAPDAGLVDRIVAAAQRTPRVVTHATPAAAITMAIAAATPKAEPESRVIAFERPAPTTRIWGRDMRRGLAVLAASLVLGLSIGQSGIMDRALLGFEDWTGVPLASASQDIGGALTDDTGGDDY